MNIKDIRQELALLNHVAPLEGQRYATCLHTYEAASNQRELILGWFTDHVIPQLSTDRASFLSVGCGAGDLDEKILTAGKEHASTVSYVGLEPDSRQCERFISRMVFENDQNIRVEAHNTCFEQFTEQRRFDLVLMVHSLYYMDDPKLALENALNLVNEFGRLVILIASNDTLNELSSSFWELENGGSTWFSEDLSGHLEETRCYVRAQAHRGNARYHVVLRAPLRAGNSHCGLRRAGTHRRIAAAPATNDLQLS